MGIRTVIECDVCGKQKQETNNWLMISTVSNAIVIRPISPAEVREDIHLHWTCLCGEACVIKFVSQNLAALHPPKQMENMQNGND